MKTELENYLDGDASDESLSEHDRKYHPNGFDSETDTCKKREGLAKGDDPRLGGAEGWKNGGASAEEEEVSRNGGGSSEEKVPEGRRIWMYTGSLGDDELCDFCEDLGKRLSSLEFRQVRLGEVDEDGKGDYSYDTYMVVSDDGIEKSDDGFVMKTRLYPSEWIGKEVDEDFKSVAKSLVSIGVGAEMDDDAEIEKLSLEDETGSRNAKMKGAFNLVVTDSAKFWKYVKGFRKPHSEEEAA